MTNVLYSVYGNSLLVLQQLANAVAKPDNFEFSSFEGY